MPMAMVRQCCPVIPNPNPTCPDGSPVPANGICPAQASCPAKFYPSLEQSGMAGTDNKFTSSYYDKKFSSLGGAWNPAWKLDSLFGISLRVNLTEWVWGIKYCQAFWKPRNSRVLACPADTYRALTGGKNTGGDNIDTTISKAGKGNLTWFGVSLAEIDKLPDNRASQETLDYMSKHKLDIVQIGSYGPPDYFGKAGPISESASIQKNNPDFVDTCNRVNGEYVMLHNEVIDGNTCSYLQCRYIHAGGGGESCLAGDVKVTLADGSQKNIADVTVGDRVKTADGAAKVTASNQYSSGLRVLYAINGDKALLTGDHPIRTRDGYKVVNEEAVKDYAGQPGFLDTPLAVGDVVLTEAGEVKVESITRKPQVQPISTFNIRLEGNQSFYADGFEVKGFDRMQMQYK